MTRLRSWALSVAWTIALVIAAARPLDAQGFPPCNPYEADCARQLTALVSAPYRWAVTDLYTDPSGGAHRFGWLVVANLARVEQDVTVLFTFDTASGRHPVLRSYHLAPLGRVSVSLHEDAELTGYYDATVYFLYDGLAWATFQPEAPPNNTNKTKVDGVFVPSRGTPMTYPLE